MHSASLQHAVGVSLGGAKSGYIPSDWSLHFNKGGAISAIGYMPYQSHTMMLLLRSYCIFFLHFESSSLLISSFRNAMITPPKANLMYFINLIISIS